MYAILSATTQFTSCALNVHHRPKRTLGGLNLDNIANRLMDIRAYGNGGCT